jgi:hypothetical protein
LLPPPLLPPSPPKSPPVEVSVADALAVAVGVVVVAPAPEEQVIVIGEFLFTTVFGAGFVVITVFAAKDAFAS